MSELFLQISISLDGYIEDAAHDIDWMVFDASVDPYATGTLESIDGMIFGRKSHGLLAGFWPGAGEAEGASAELAAQARLMNRLPKYVLTHGEETTGWANSHAIRAEDVPRLKRGGRSAAGRVRRRRRPAVAARAGGHRRDPADPVSGAGRRHAPVRR